MYFCNGRVGRKDNRLQIFNLLQSGPHVNIQAANVIFSNTRIQLGYEHDAMLISKQPAMRPKFVLLALAVISFGILSGQEAALFSKECRISSGYSYANGLEDSKSGSSMF